MTVICDTRNTEWLSKIVAEIREATRGWET
jgi:hypothetical protein